MIEYLLPIALTVGFIGLLCVIVGMSQFGGPNFFAWLAMGGMGVNVDWSSNCNRSACHHPNLSMDLEDAMRFTFRQAVLWSVLSIACVIVAVFIFFGGYFSLLGLSLALNLTLGWRLVGHDKMLALLGLKGQG